MRDDRLIEYFTAQFQSLRLHLYRFFPLLSLSLPRVSFDWYYCNKKQKKKKKATREQNLSCSSSDGNNTVVVPFSILLS